MRLCDRILEPPGPWSMRHTERRTFVVSGVVLFMLSILCTSYLVSNSVAPGRGWPGDWTG